MVEVVVVLVVGFIFGAFFWGIRGILGRFLGVETWVFIFNLKNTDEKLILFVIFNVKKLCKFGGRWRGGCFEKVGLGFC